MAFSNKILNYIHSHLVLEDLLEYTAEKFPKTVAFQLWQDHRITQHITYKSLLEVVRREGERLKKIGVEKGMRVALIEENSIDWVIAFLSILHCQATAILIDPRLSNQDYLNLFSLSDPQLLVLGHNYRSKIEDSVSIPIITIENEKFQFPPLPVHIKSSFDNDSSLAVFIFTSGTTGNFKAVMLDHQAILYSVKGGIEALNDGLREHLLATLPLTHIYGLTSNLIAPLANGMTVTFLDKLQGELILNAMKDTQTHTFPAVPRIINLFAMRIQQEIDKKSPKVSHFLRRLIHLCYRLRTKTGLNLGRLLFNSVHKKFGRHLKAFVSGGSPSDNDLVQFMEGLGFVILEGYGLSETTGMICCQNFHDKPRAGSVGKLPPWMNIQIVKTSPEQKDGEILIKGPSVMKGYFRDPLQTEQVLKNGWFYTGDLGYLTDDGELYITGRIKEIIVTASGQKAMPLDVERRYQNIQGIQELAVFGVSTPPSNAEDIHAAIIIQEESVTHLISEKERYFFIVEKIAKRSETIPTHLRIAQVHLVESIPKTSTLKVKRKELTRLFAISTESLKPFATESISPSLPKSSSTKASTEKELSSALSEHEKNLETELFPKIILLVQNVCELTKKKLNKPLDRSTNFQMDLNFDSLDALELVFAVEKELKIRFPHNLDKIHTIGDLQDSLISYLNKQHQALSDTSALSSTNSISSPLIITSQEIEITEIEIPQQQKIISVSAESRKETVDTPFTMQGSSEIENQIIEITKTLSLLNKKIADKEIARDTNFQIDLAFDSLIILDLIFEIEKQFKISLKDLPFDQIHTIHELAEFVQKTKEKFAGLQFLETENDLHKNFLARAKEIPSAPIFERTLIKKTMARVVEFFYGNYFNVTSTGKAFLPSEPYILCANHCSHLDVLALILATGSPIDSFAALAAKDYFFEGPKYRRWFTSWLNIIPFNRDSQPYAIIDNLVLCKQVLEKKQNLILFPEGTRSTNGQLQSFKSFVGVLGVELPYPLVPAFIHGTFDLMPKGKNFPTPGKIEVSFGPPILATKLEETGQHHKTALYQKVIQEVYHQINELSKKFQGNTNE